MSHLNFYMYFFFNFWRYIYTARRKHKSLRTFILYCKTGNKILQLFENGDFLPDVVHFLNNLFLSCNVTSRDIARFRFSEWNYTSSFSYLLYTEPNFLNLQRSVSRFPHHLNYLLFFLMRYAKCSSAQQLTVPLIYNCIHSRNFLV